MKNNCLFGIICCLAVVFHSACGASPKRSVAGTAASKPPTGSATAKAPTTGGANKAQKDLARKLARLDAEEEKLKQRLFVITKEREDYLAQLRKVLPAADQSVKNHSPTQAKQQAPRTDEVDSELAAYLQKKRAQLEQIEGGMETLRQYEGYLDRRKRELHSN